MKTSSAELALLRGTMSRSPLRGVDSAFPSVDASSPEQLWNEWLASSRPHNPVKHVVFSASEDLDLHRLIQVQSWENATADWLATVPRLDPVGEGYVYSQLVARSVETIAVEQTQAVSADEQRLTHDTLRRTSNGVLLVVVATQAITLVTGARLVHPALAGVALVSCVFFLAMSRAMRNEMKRILADNPDSRRMV